MGAREAIRWALSGRKMLIPELEAAVSGAATPEAIRDMLRRGELTVTRHYHPDGRHVDSEGKAWDGLVWITGGLADGDD